ncbi:MAG TPA: polysaccharide biosynthesis/export family protein [Burkholderiaceae bacterium]|nr:polysaccharide biosynthesis/export family protein [Burkholderiaceae bacterium]
MHFNVSSATSGSPFGAVNPDVKPVVKTITPQLVKLEKAQREKQTTQDISNLVAGPKPYHIQGGDILSIVVWDHPELSTGAAAMPQQGTVGADTPPGGMPPPAGFVVSHEGTIQFPYAGPLKVAGLTEAQARSLLASKLAKYIRHPNVTLRVQSYRSKRVYVDGEVKTPGLQPITDIPMTLMEALNRAGGLLPSADQSRVSITREGQTYNINLMQLTQRGVNPARIMLANGDVVRVMSREDNKIFVSGEVMQPKSLPMHNGRLTLNEALGDAGGINPQTGDGRQVYVIRNATEKEPIVYHLDARSPAGLAMAEEFELRPKDVVYVDAAPLATWHRVISLILPGALTQAVQTGKN